MAEDERDEVNLTRRMRVFFKHCTAVLIVVCLTTAWVHSAEPVKIGAFVSLTGKYKVYGTELKRGLELAKAAINEAGGIAGRPVDLLIRDDQSDPLSATKTILELIRHEKITAIIGGTVSELAITGAQVCQRENVIMITPFATNPIITDVGKNIFRVSFNDRSQASVMARFIKNERNTDRVYILRNVSNTYSNDLSGYFQKSFEALGGTIPGILDYDQNTVDFTGILKPLAEETKPFGIYLPGYGIDTARIVKTLDRLKIRTTLFGADTWDSKDLLSLVGESFKEGYYTTLYDAAITSKENSLFVGRYKAKHGTVPTPDALAAYEALNVLAQAMNLAQDLSTRSIRKAITKVDYNGPAGHVRFNASGDANRDIVIIRIRNGHRKLYKLFGNKH